MNLDEFIDTVIDTARAHGYEIEDSRNGRQINFGNKKLHEKHLMNLFPHILADGTNVRALINSAAPGRSCVAKPLRQLIAEIKARGGN